MEKKNTNSSSLFLLNFLFGFIFFIYTISLIKLSGRDAYLVWGLLTFIAFIYILILRVSIKQSDNKEVAGGYLISIAGFISSMFFQSLVAVKLILHYL